MKRPGTSRLAARKTWASRNRLMRNYTGMPSTRSWGQILTFFCRSASRTQLLLNTIVSVFFGWLFQSLCVGQFRFERKSEFFRAVSSCLSRKKLDNFLSVCFTHWMFLAVFVKKQCIGFWNSGNSNLHWIEVFILSMPTYGSKQGGHALFFFVFYGFFQIIYVFLWCLFWRRFSSKLRGNRSSLIFFRCELLPQRKKIQANSFELVSWIPVLCGVSQNQYVSLWPYICSKTALNTMSHFFNDTYLVEVKGPCSPLSFLFQRFLREFTCFYGDCFRGSCGAASV